jgi:hypothetical protein
LCEQRIGDLVPNPLLKKLLTPYSLPIMLVDGSLGGTAGQLPCSKGSKGRKGSMKRRRGMHRESVGRRKRELPAGVGKPLLQPPAGLPRGYLEVWKALNAANERAASRQALAGALGLSTHTIQRILVNGEVPQFPEARNTRIVRSWVRILTRLAFYAGEEPRRWIEAIGIPWSDDTRAASEAASRRAAMRSAGITSEMPSRPSAPSASAATAAAAAGGGAPGETRALWRRVLRVGITERSPFSKLLPTFGRSFLEEYARRVLVALSPEARLEFQTMGEQDVVAGLVGPAPALDLGVGIAETVDRKFLGIEFVPLPGWCMRLSALCLHRRATGAPVPAWQEVVAPASLHNVVYLVLADGVGTHFLRGHCGIPADRLMAVQTPAPGEIAEALLGVTERKPDCLTVLVADEATSALVAEYLRPLPRVVEAYAVERLPGAEAEYPTYPVGLAVGPALGAWGRDLLAQATREMFASVPRMTAGLYASLMAHSVLAREAARLLDTTSARAVVGLADFDEASAEFRRVLETALTQDLARGLEQTLAVCGLFPAGAGIGEIARRLAVRFVQHLLPDEWNSGADSIPLMTVASPYCLSCAAPLHDEHNKGASDRFCRYCSDEHGHLRPRSDVERILAGWLRRGGDAPAPEEAARRAKLFMESMPAWCNN